MIDKAKNNSILFDLNHPADYHFFKNLFIQLHKEGYLINVIARDKDCLQDLLINANIRFLSRGSGSNSKVGKYIYGIYILLLILIKLLKTKPKITVSLSSPYLAIASRILGIPCITYDDTDDNPRLRPMLKHSTYIFSPSKYPYKFHRNHFNIEALKELAYLHPRYFQSKERGSGLFVRLTRTDSIHHTSGSRIDINLIINQINKLSESTPTWLSSEIDLHNRNLYDGIQHPDVLNIHDYLLKTGVFWGNSATMAAEAAVLGIPTVFVSNEKFSYIKELESFGLLFYYTPDQLNNSFKKVEELLAKEPGEDFVLLSHKLIKEKIDITGFLKWFIKDLPESAEIMRSDPDYQRHFLSETY